MLWVQPRQLSLRFTLQELLVVVTMRGSPPCGAPQILCASCFHVARDNWRNQWTRHSHCLVDCVGLPICLSPSMDRNLRSHKKGFVRPSTRAVVSKDAALFTDVERSPQHSDECPVWAGTEAAISSGRIGARSAQEKPFRTNQAWRGVHHTG